MLRLCTAIMAIALTAMGCNEKSADAPKGKTEAPKSAAATSKAPASGSNTEAVEALGAAAAKIKGGKELLNAAKDGKSAIEGLAKDGKGLTEAQFEALLVGLAACSVDDNGIDRKCPAYKAYREGRKNRGTLIKDWGGMMSRLGSKHLDHEAPAVRIQAAGLMGSIFGASKDSQSAIVTAAKSEKHPRVLKSMLRAVGSSIKKNDEVRKLLLANAGHENAKVRMEVVGSLTSSWAKETEGTLEKAMEMVEKDPAPEVRQYACRRLGERADERALPLLKKLTADHEQDPKLYSACVRGLIAMWSAPVPHKQPSQKAYDATLAIFKKVPRDENHPPWTAVSAVEWASKDRFQKAAPWFKKGELITALANLIKDRKANWLARTGSVDAMKRLGATKADFEGLKKAYADAAGKPGTDKHVLDKIEKVLKAAK